MRIILGLVFFLLTFTCHVFADWASERSSLREKFEIDEFRIFYSLSGKHALPKSKRIDSDNNGHPDFVENIGEQFISARNFFSKQVGLVHPLNSDRYSSKAHCIDINLMKMPLKPGGPKNGMAYDGTPGFNRRSDPSGLHVLAIDISTNLSPTNPTPGHELFHLYQNGYTLFKNRWYTEGTARWAEKTLNHSRGKPGSLPKNAHEALALFEKTYNADTFWNALIVKVDSGSHGKDFMKAFLEEMQKTDKIASQDRGLNPYSWKESVQKDSSNNPYIWKALIKTLKQSQFKQNWDPSIEKMIEIPI